MTGTDPRPTKHIDRWNAALRRNEPFPCGDCGQPVTATERHTWDDCRAYEKAKAAAR